MAMAGPSTRLPKSDCRRFRESLVAAARSRRSKRRFEPGIRICKACAWRWRIGTQSCGSCKPAQGWPVLRHVRPTFVRVATAWRDGQGCGGNVRQLSNRLTRLEAAFPAVSADPFGDALDFALRNLSGDDAGRAIDVALHRASDADLKFLVEHLSPNDRGEPPTPAHRRTWYRLGEMVRAAVKEFCAAGFVRATDGGMA
jgi:hypothetical protein